MHPSEKLDEIRPAIVRIDASWTIDDGATVHATGTGVVVGRYRDCGHLMVATARHVINAIPVDRAVTWNLLQQLDDTGEGDRRLRPYMFADNCIHATRHNTLDIAVIQIPAKAFPDADPHADLYNTTVRTIDPGMGIGTGGPVAWAGFPLTVEQALGHPQLLVHTGIVAAMIHGEGKRQLYIVDGHATGGVSGGPVWHYSEDRERAEVIGMIVSAPNNYRKGDLPGYVFVEPMGPVMLELERMRRQVLEEDFLITACRN